jgi:hypothetical protein
LKLESDARFEAEEREFALRRTCEDCALWDDAADACAHGYPTEEHRRSRTSLVVFCKDFELA